MSTSSLKALSHLTLAAPTPGLFKETLAFYSLLGFKIISAPSGTASPQSTTYHPTIPLHEAWLHLFPPGAADHAHEAAEGGYGLSLRLMVEEHKFFDEEKFAEKVRGKFDRLRQEQHVHDPAWACFIVEDIRVGFLCVVFFEFWLEE